MRTFIIAILILELLTINGNAQARPMDLPYWFRESFKIEEVNGVSVWKRNNRRVTDEVHIMMDQDFSTSTVYHDEMKGRLVNGLKQGKWIYWRAHTGIIKEVHYNKGLVNGKYKVTNRISRVIRFDDQGKPIKDKLVNIDTVYYETTFINGNGMWKEFYEDGTIQEEGRLKAGRKHGEWCYYTRIGNFLFRKRYYEDGILIEQEDYNIPEEYLSPLRY